MIESWTAKTKLEWIDRLGEKLGILPDALRALDCAWCASQTAWAFPMRDGDDSIIGIRLRNGSGQKWAVKGSRQGIFIPRFPVTPTVCICEGPTDTATAISMGIFAVGRPSCCCGNDQIKAAFERLNVRRALIISDNDKPGVDGAVRLAADLQIPTCTFVPPAKDLREFVRNGGTLQLIETIAKDLVWNMPHKNFESAAKIQDEP